MQMQFSRYKYALGSKITFTEYFKMFKTFFALWAYLLEPPPQDYSDNSHFSNRIEKLHRMASIYIYIFFFWKSLKKLKKLGFLGLNFSYTVLYPLYSERYHIPKHLSVYIWLLINLLDFLTNIKGNQQVQRQMENHWHQCMTCCGLFVHT